MDDGEDGGGGLGQRGGLRGSAGCNLNNLTGSRNSLSGSMKRWTTEENLSSYEGSIAGSKTDLLESTGQAMIHGSHSNSTDSGIQACSTDCNMNN